MLISIGSLILGILATVLVSRYYFRRSLEKSLTPYIQFSSSPLRGIDPKVRSDLDIRYQGHPVANLYEIQFLIANTGDKAIHDVIEPLSLTIPDGSDLLDASLLHVEPAGRKIDVLISENRNQISFGMALLNSREFFIVKLLLNGEPKTSDFIFRITADELPPVLKAERLPYDAVRTSAKWRFDFAPLIIGLILIIIGIAVADLIFNEWARLPVWNFWRPLAFFQNLRLSDCAVLLSVVPVVIFLCLGVMAVMAAFSEGTFPPSKRKYVVPNDQLLRRWRGPLRPDVSPEDWFE